MVKKGGGEDGGGSDRQSWKGVTRRSMWNRVSSYHLPKMMQQINGRNAEHTTTSQSLFE